MNSMHRTLHIVSAASALLFALASPVLAQVDPPATIFWTGASNSLWSVPGNWNPARVPLTSDHVEIATGTNVQLDVAASISSLRMGQSSGSSTQTLVMNADQTLTLATNSTVNSNGVISISGGAVASAGLLSVQGRMDWSGGILAGTLEIAPGATLNLIGPANKLIGGNSTLRNKGTITWEGTGDFGGPIGARVENFGLFDVRNDQAFFDSEYYDYDRPVFVNAGRFRKSGGTGATRFEGGNQGTLFTNVGIVEIQGGTLSLRSVTALGNGGTFAGTGLTSQDAGAVTIFGTNTVVAGATLQLSTATMNGTGAFAGPGSLQWTNGSSLNATLTILPEATLRLAASTSSEINAGTLLNLGLVTQQGAGSFNGRNGCAIRNFGTWALGDNTAFIDSEYYDYVSPVFENLGTLRKSSGAGAVTFDGGNQGFVLTNASLVQIDSGSLRLRSSTKLGPGGTFAGAGFTSQDIGDITFFGTNTLSASTLFQIGPAVINANNGAVAGSGMLQWTNGSSLSGTLTILPNAVLRLASTSSSEINGGTLVNFGTVEHSGGGSFNGRNGCLIRNLGTWTLRSDAPFVDVEYYDYISPQFENRGTLFKDVAGTNIFRPDNQGFQFHNAGLAHVQSGTVAFNGGGAHTNGEFRVNAGATLEMASGQNTLRDGARFNVSGLARVAGAGLTQVDTTNTILAGGNFVFSGGTLSGRSAIGGPGTVTWSGGTLAGTNTLLAGGTMNISGDATKQIAPNARLVNAGTMRWTDNGDIAAQINSVLRNENVFEVRNDRAFVDNEYYDYGNPRFENAGTFRKVASTGTTRFGGENQGFAFVNDGVLDAAAGTVRFESTFAPGGSSTTRLAVGGATPGTEFGRIVHGGAMNLAGQLQVVLTNGFAPTNGQTFTVVASGSLGGGFSTTTLPALSAGLTWSVDQNLTSVVLGIENLQPCAVPPGDLVLWAPAEGNAYDVIGGSIGALHNGATFSAGRMGQGFRLDGANNFVSFPDSPSVRPTNLTIEGWFKFYSTPSADILVSKTVGSGILNSYALYLLNGTLNAVVSDVATFGNIATPFTPALNTWYHLAFTFDDGSNLLRLFTNGVLAASQTENRSIAYDAHPLLIGAEYENESLTAFAHGLIDEVSLYRRALDTGEIASIYGAGLSGKCTNGVLTPTCLPPPGGLVGWWPGDDSSINLAPGVPANLLNGVTYGPGVVAQAFSFDGSDDMISVGNLPALQGATELTLAAWILNEQGAANSAGILGQWDTTGNVAENSFLLYRGESGFANRGGFGLQFDDDSVGFVQGVSQLPVGDWIHIAATWSSSNGLMRLYKNGALDASSTNGVGQVLRHHTAFTAKIGEWGKNNNGSVTHWRGLIDEPMIFTRSLGSNEIAAIHAAGIAGVCRPSGSTSNVSTTLTLVSDTTNWRESTTNDTINASSNPWLGATFLPAASTYTVTPTAGAGHVYPVPGATTLFGGNSVRFFRSTFILPNFDTLTADISASFDNDLQIFINGHELAVEGDLTGGSFSAPNHRLFVYTDGSVINGYEGGKEFSTRVADNFPPSFFQAGTNEIILALRNLNGGDSGGVAFRGDFATSGGGPAFLPDLVVTSVNGPAGALMGQAVPLAYTIRNNNGTTAFGPWLNEFRIATNSSGGGAQSIGTVPFFGELPPGASLTITQSVILPAGVSGTRYLGVSVDAIGAIAETSETNNIAFSTAIITINAADLQPTILRSTNTARFGQSVEIVFAVTNQGNANATAVGSDQIFLSPFSNSLSGATFLVSVPGAVLSPGTSYTRTQTVDLPLIPGAPAGTYYVTVLADADNAQPESNENNNDVVTSINLTYPPLPDLRVSSVVAPASVSPGTTATITWTTTNQGSLTVTSSWSEVVSISNSVFGVQSLAEIYHTNNLPPGGQVTRAESVPLPGTLAAGEWRFFVRTDSRFDIFESNEGNNSTVAGNASQVQAKLTLTLPTTEVLEGAAPVLATLTRNGDRTPPLTVTITNSDPSELQVTNSIVIPAGQVSVTFAVTPRTDGVVDGPQVAGVGVTATGYEGASANLTVLDVDVPRLTISLGAATVVEGLTVSATVSRDYATNLPLLVIVKGFDSAQLTVPASVNIPANQLSVTFLVSTVNDVLIEPSRSYSVEVSADGFELAIGSVIVIDNDLPTVSMVIVAENISEGAGPQAASGLITRNPVSDRELILELTSSDTNSVLVTETVTIPVGAASVSFPIAAVDNNIVDGSRTVTIRIYVRDSSGNLIAEGTPDTLQILDDDGPTLKLTIARDLVDEGQNPASTATVTRNTATNIALFVNLASSDATELSVASSVSIPAGERSSTFNLISLLDQITDGNQTVTVSASAGGFTPGADIIVVTDIDLPDFVVANVTVPTNGQTDASFSIAYRVENRGVSPSTTPFITRAFLSADTFLGEDALLGEFPFQGTLPVDFFIEQTSQFRLPSVVGRYWLIIVADAANQVAEGLENNNSFVSASPIDVVAGYTATVETSVTNAPAGTPVPMSGSAIRAGTGLPAPNVPVNVHVLLRGIRRVLSVVTDINGNFTTTFTALPGEAGLYQIGAAHPGAAAASVQDTFTVLAMRANPGSVTLKLPEQSSVTGEITLENLGDSSLRQLGVSILNKPDTLNITTELGNNGVLPGSGSIRLGFAITALQSPNQQSGTVIFRVSGADGVTLDIPLQITIEPLRPRLVAYPPDLQLSVVRGRQRFVEFEIVNEGGAESGPLQISLPPLSWLSLVSSNPVPSMAIGATNRVTLSLNPPTNAPLTEFSGNLAINGTNSSLAVPLRIRTVSTALADLRIIAEDEFTYFAEGAPRVTNATVTVSDSVTKTAVTNGVVNGQGEFRIGRLTEGYYDLEVKAPKHQSFKQTILLSADQTNEVRAFMSLQLVTYNWTVTPIQTEDRYRITLETTFEANVPAPVVTLSPDTLDLGALDFVDGIAQVNFVLENHGLIGADAGQLRLPLVEEYEFTALVTNIGRIPAKSSFLVPVQIKKKRGIIETLTGPVIASDTSPLVDFIPPLPHVTVPPPSDGGVLNANSPANGSLTNGQAVLYQLLVPAGETLEVVLNSAPQVGTNDMYLRFGAAPTQTTFDFFTIDSTSPDGRLVVPTTQAGTYYLLVHARNMAASPANYSLTARVLPFTVTGTSTRLLDTSGPATFRVEGARFDEDSTRMVLIGNGQTNFPVDFLVQDASSILMTFNLAGKPAGFYDLYAIQVTNRAQLSPAGDDVIVTEAISAQALLTNHFQVVNNQPGALAARVILPDQVQFGREFPFQVVFTNTGGTDFTTPLVRISGRNQVGFAPEAGGPAERDTETVVRLLGQLRNTSLTPGETVTLTFFGQITSRANAAYVEVQDLTLTNGPITWSEFKAYYQALVITEDWEQTWASFQQRAGNTLSSLRAALAAAVLNPPPAPGTSTVLADSLLFRLLEPSPSDSSRTSGALVGSLLPSSFDPFAPVSKLKAGTKARGPLPGLPEQCETWRNLNVPLFVLRTAKIGLRRSLQSALFALYGTEVAGSWDIFLNYDFENSPTVPNRLMFTDGSEFVDGARGKVGFKDSLITKAAVFSFMKDVKIALTNKLRDCKLDCHNLPPSMTLEELFKDEPDKGSNALARFDMSLDYHEDEAGIPSNTAGGRSGSFRGTKDEGRLLLKQSRVLLKPVRSKCGNLQRLVLETDFIMEYDDSLDFCPGGLAECRSWATGNKLLNDSPLEVLRAAAVEIGHAGTCLPRAASIGLQILESYELAYSVPFTVRFKPEPQMDDISFTAKNGPQRLCPQKCCPAKVGMDYSYECGPNRVAKQAQSVVNNSQCKEGSEGVPDCQATGEGFAGLPPFGGGGDEDGGGADSGGSAEVFSTEAPCTPAGAQRGSISKGRSAEPSGEVCAKVKLRLDQDLITTRDAFQASLEISNNTPTPLEAIQVSLVVRDENGEDATELFGIRAPILDGLSGVNGSGVVSGNSIGKASWVLIPTIDAATNGPTKYYVSGSFSYTLNGLRITVPLAPAPITALPSASLVLKYFHQRDVFSDDPYTLPIEPSIPFSLAILIQNNGKGAANNLRITSGQPKIVENEKGLLIDFEIVGTEVAGQPQSPSLTANFGTIPAGQIAIARWLLTSSLQGLFIDYKATFEHLDAIGNKRLSLIDHVEIHEMNHLVQAPGALEDGLPDFLVNDVPDADDSPDTIYLSSGTTSRVEVVTLAMLDGAPSAGDLTVQLTAALPTGWAYLRIPDPANGQLRLTRMVRSDGAEIYVGTNVWTTDRTFIGLGKRPLTENRLHLVDYNSPGGYTLYYTPLPPVDFALPASMVQGLPTNNYPQFPVRWSGTDGSDGSGVSFFDIFVSLDGGPFTPWLQRTPFNSSIYQGQAGHTYSFYSIAVDASGNREPAPVGPDAQTTVSLSNTAPILTLPGQVIINEGATLSLTPTVMDADAGQTLTFVLLSGAPAGVVLNSLNGQITWVTGEGNGPGTNQISVVVTDNGQPSLSATSIVSVIVNEINSAPTLAPVGNRTINELQNLSIPLGAGDTDIPVQKLTFSLGLGAPAGATLNSSNGVFSWTPNTTQGPTTNNFVFIVRDNGTPQLSATQTFTVIVRDTRADFTVGLGSTNLYAGQSGHVPINLQSGIDLTNISLFLNLSANGMTNLTLAPAAPSVGSVTLSPSGPNRYQVRLAASAGEILEGIGEFARLAFATSTNLPSALVHLQPENIVGVRATGEVVPGGGVSGRVIVVNREPVLVASGFAPRRLEVFGRPGVTYDLLTSTNVIGPWLPAGNVTLAEAISSVLTLQVSGQNIFYRAVENSGAPLLEYVSAGNRIDFTIRGETGRTYTFQSSLVVTGPWANEFSLTFTNAFRSFSRTNGGEPAKFFRVRRD